MAEIHLIQYARLLGSTTVIGMAEKLGVAALTPPISVKHLVDLAAQIIKPFAPVDLQPPDGSSVVSNAPRLLFRDPGAGTPAAAFSFHVLVTHNNILVGSPPLTGGADIGSPISPPGFTWGFPLPQGENTLIVSGINRAGRGPESTATFTVNLPAPPPPPQPATATATLTISVGISAFGLKRSITAVNMMLAGPGAPTAAIPFQMSPDRSTAKAALNLPKPPSGQSSVLYTATATTLFHYEGLTNPNSGEISGPEDTAIGLTAPVGILWTGQNRTAMFSVNYDGFNNTFTMSFDGLI